MLHNFWRLAAGCILFSLISPRVSVAAGPALQDPHGQDPFYVNQDYPKLTTPQWVGESGVEAVVVLAIDDMRDTARYEAFLRPILERLKQIDGRAPVSIMVNAVNPREPRLQTWLKEGLSLEAHTLAHPCPCLAQGNFQAAADTYHGCVELLNQIGGGRPVAFRMPCCDSMNSPSPRFYAEIFNRTNAAGQFLEIDSSVMHLFTSRDPSLPIEWVKDPDGSERFSKYLPRQTNAITKVNLGSFVTTIENYPYPYVLGRLCWEFPAMVPSDWEAQNVHGPNHSKTVEDWKIALEATVRKQGVLTFIFHPHAWIKPEQLIEVIDYAVERFGRRVKFLTFPEALRRLNTHLLAGSSLRDAAGQDHGVRLLDLNGDGFLDLLVGNDSRRVTRIWQPGTATWRETPWPGPPLSQGPRDPASSTGVRFGQPEGAGSVLALAVTDEFTNAWTFQGTNWIEDRDYLRGLKIEDRPVQSLRAGRDRGVRFRDVDQDGRSELLVSNPDQNALFSWSQMERIWRRVDFALPDDARLVNADGLDHGVRFVDLNHDGFEDVVVSNESRWSIHLFVAEPIPNWQWDVGWTRLVRGGLRGEPGEIPAFVRPGLWRDNGAWFHSNHLWVQNEDTAHLPDRVDRRSFADLVAFEAPPPLSPEASLAAMRVRPGFRVELVAAEPLVEDPVALDWGADGRLWIAEMHDYPEGLDGKGQAGGRVRFLEDTNGDGRYDRSTVFLSDLPFPTGVMPWRRGVLVSAAPDIFYAEDTDGDGRADRRETLFSGFDLGNQQHRVNGFEYGLDNWIYAANGESGGLIRVAGNDRELDMRGRDLRFQPDSRALDFVEGQTQFGRRRDDWGHWFGNNNPTWLWHYYFPERYAARNPFLSLRSTKRVLARYDGGERAYSISRTLQRFNWPDLHNTVTSGCSPTPYRDDLFGPEFATSVFMSEPAHNLVHREVLEKAGVSFTSHRAQGEEQCEFLASEDNWFRPTMLKIGPDGALYVADMYRLVIEHPEYAMADMKRQIDLRAGSDRGRIYRVSPENASLRPIPRLDSLETPRLAAALDSPNGWQRDTAQRLLVHRQDAAAVPVLTAMVSQSTRPQSRLQALATLDGLMALDAGLVAQALADRHPAVRRWAILLAEPFLRDPVRFAQTLAPPLAALAEDPDDEVRFQLALSLGEWKDPRAGLILTRLAEKAQGQLDFSMAILSSAAGHEPSLIPALLSRARDAVPPEIFQPLIRQTVVSKNIDALRALQAAFATAERHPPQSWQWDGWAFLLEKMKQQGVTWKEFQDASDSQAGALTEVAARTTKAMTQWALDGTSDSTLAPPRRLAALRYLAVAGRELDLDWHWVSELLNPLQPPEIHQATLDYLRSRAGQPLNEMVLASWTHYSPAVRAGLLELGFQDQDATQLVLTWIEEGRVLANQVNARTRQRFLELPNPTLRERAERIFGRVNQNRKQVLEAYDSVRTMSGHSDHGRALYQEHCSSCHRFGGEGFSVGPDLATLTGKPIETFLVAVLDPNQAVETPFVQYTATLRGGEEFSGVIVSESGQTLVLRGSGGQDHVIQRADLDRLESSGLSAMPEGLELTLTPQDLADLIAYLRGF